MIRCTRARPGRIGNDGRAPPAAQPLEQERLLHGEARGEDERARHFPRTQGRARRIGDVEHRDRHRVFYLRMNFVHGVGADQNRVRPLPLEPSRSFGEDIGERLPVTRRLQGRDPREIEGMKQDCGGRQSPDPIPYATVQFAIVDCSTFPAHSAEQSESLHKRLHDPLWCSR